MPQPRLRTDRLDLVPLAAEHLEHEVELDADADVLRFLWSRPRTRAEVEDLHRRRVSRADEVDGLGLWAGFVSAPTAFVGLWMLTPPHGPSPRAVPREADLGFRIHQRYWRRGLATEGARELLRHGFTTVGLRRIFAQTMAVNVASRATMRALDMRFVRSFHEEHEDVVPGADRGEVEYELLRDEWAQRTARR